MNSKMVQGVKKALELNRAVYEHLRSHIRCGMTELDIKEMIEQIYKKESGMEVNYLCDILSGERCSEISGDATKRKIKQDDAIILDLLPHVDGFWCDTTRTFFVGNPTQYWRKAYDCVVNAISCAERFIKPGVTAGQIHNIVHTVIENGGFKGYFPHHAGHCVGRDSFEEPDFIADSNGVITKDMVITIEPGIYVPGDTGVRVEDNYVITENGLENLFHYPRDIEYFTIEG